MNMDYSKAFELLNQDAEKERNKKADVKQQLLDKLSKEPLMVISTAYVYAKNYVMYGEDITKAWTTAVQQASILEQVKIKAQTEAYDSFKKDYENRLKTEMAAMLDKIKAEIEEEKEHAYADFERYKVDYLGQEWEDALDSLPIDDFRYGMERTIEIIDKYKNSEG